MPLFRICFTDDGPDLDAHRGFSTETQEIEAANKDEARKIFKNGRNGDGFILVILSL